MFGVEEYAAAVADPDAYTYGTSHENIAYCGAYLVKSAVAENSIVFEANPTYWNKDNVQIKTLSWKFISGKNATESYDLMVDGTFAGSGLNSDAAAKAKADGNFEKFAYVSGTDSTSFGGFINVNRTATANFNDG